MIPKLQITAGGSIPIEEIVYKEKVNTIPEGTHKGVLNGRTLVIHSSEGIYEITLDEGIRGSAEGSVTYVDGRLELNFTDKD